LTNNLVALIDPADDIDLRGVPQLVKV